jgi:centrin-1
VFLIVLRIQTLRSITSAEEEVIRHAFQLFDTDGVGQVSVKEIREALEEGGSERAKSLLKCLPKGDDKEEGGSSYLTLDEFLSLFTQRLHDDDDDDDTVDDMTRMFRLFDKDRKGFIEVKDLKRIAADLGESMTEMELREMIDRGSSHEQGKVTLEEFTAIMTKKLWS